jgi:two-component system chemotaxis response regulator CheY
VKTILIVDDSATMRRMIRASLRSLGELRFDEAQSGLEAIERLALATADLMTLDLNMPDMHGLDVLRFVRGQLAYQGLPIIVLTTRGDAAAQEETIAAGASLFLSKPFHPETLAQRVRELLHA